MICTDVRSALIAFFRAQRFLPMLGALLASALLLHATAAAAADWPMFGQNLQNTAATVTNSGKDVAQLNVKWTFTTGGDVSARAAVANGVGDCAGHAFDRGDLLSDGAAGRDLTRFLVVAVHEDGARGAEAGAAAELRPLESEHVSEDPQQWRRLVPIVDLGLGAVHAQSHVKEHARRRCR